MKIISLIGGTGLIGKRLTDVLIKSGYKVRLFTRDVNSARGIFPDAVELIEWKNDLYALTEQLNGNYGVINLAGASIAGAKWTAEYKTEILESRINTTALIVDAIKQADVKPKVLVNASAIGIYGSAGDTFLTEKSEYGKNFLAEVTKAWESEVLEAKDITRVVILRIGIVLAPDGGAIEKMLLPFKMFVGGPLGNGKQYWSWVHIDDVVAMFAYALLNDMMQGIYNAVAPNPVKMKQFAKTLGKVLNRPSFMHVPDFILYGLLGESAEMVLASQNVSSHKITDAGFIFKYPELEAALADVIRKKQ
jgi:uncharacterized protein (TIGR01777 family)